MLWSLFGLCLFTPLEVAAAGYFLFFSRTYYRPLYLEWRDNHWLWRTEHHDWGAWHRPSSVAHQAERCFTVSYRSNAYGARGRERTTTAHAKRAVLLGDSFIEGFGVEEPDRLSNLLEQHLGFEMLNFGSAVAGPLHYQILYEQLARKFDHDLVIIGLLPQNDFTDNDPDFIRKSIGDQSFVEYYRPYYSPHGGTFYPRARPTPDWQPFATWADLPNHRSWHDNLRHVFWLYGLREEIRTIMKSRTHATGDYVGYLESNPVRISNVIGSICAIQRSASPRRVLVVFVPDYKSWAYVESHPRAYAKSVAIRVGNLLQRDGITTIDLLKKFMDQHLDKDALYLPCDGHWSSAGNRAAFNVLSPIVDDLLRSAHAVATRGSVPKPPVTLPD